MKQNNSPNSPSRMTALERRAAMSLAGIFSTRMLGLFMIMPIFSIYALELEGVTPLLTGVAIGIYGLTQALLQIPFGRLSDRIGRKKVILAGLVLFVIGSVVAALSTTIEGVIIGRALQGSGAIASAIMALTADLTREDHRTKAMAIIGMSIGASFALSMVLGPVVYSTLGGAGIFWVIAVLAIVAMLILHWQVPTPVNQRVHPDAEVVNQHIGEILRNTQLLRLDFGILILHMVLTATFVVMPLVLQDIAGLDVASHAYLYLPVFLISAALMVPFIIMAEKYRRMRGVFIGAILCLGLVELGLGTLGTGFWPIVILLVLFFTAFNILEACLPSIVSKLAPAHKKGTAMGVYSSSQFFGAFLGGVTGGWVYGEYGLSAVFLMSAGLILLWWLWAATMAPLVYAASRVVSFDDIQPEQVKELLSALQNLSGVTEAVVLAEENTAYLKLDKDTFDETALQAVMQKFHQK